MIERSGEYMAEVVNTHCTTHNTHHKMAFLHELYGNFPDTPLEAEKTDDSSREYSESLHIQIVHYAFTKSFGDANACEQPIGIVDLNAVSVGVKRQGIFRYEILLDGKICHSRTLHVNSSNHNKVQRYAKEEPSLLPSTTIHRCGIDGTRLSNASYTIETVVYRSDSSINRSDKVWREIERLTSHWQHSPQSKLDA